MAGSSAVAHVHPWLGELRWYGRGELIGSIDIEPDVRAPRSNGGRDAEVLLRVTAPLQGPALHDYLDKCAARIRDVLARLESVKDFTVRHAPEDWLAQCAPDSGTPADLLFLDGLEIDEQLRLALIFDFGALDQLVTSMDGEGNATAVHLRP